ncbi:uncharacterized protein LOC130086993 [Rhinichthys klamathensis goyatoka]|uniref:uncharacterized protein LOC130086993 n=1 Tax=Rhinichthys klamathensis goyatoka TaxID=3034132 RepID=UPI0024B4C2CF|nr:uncharacterized protein LOC130086993 [Rhinichthys klamathensis goyatoka]
MKTVLFFFVFYVVMNGVFGESVSVKEGDSVTLHADLLEIQRDDVLEWRFGAEGFLIARINRGANTSSIYDDVLDGRFRDRLKLDKQTGYLTITNTRTEHAGVYEVEVTSTRNKTFNVTVLPVDAVKSVSVLLGDSVTLNTDLTEIQRGDVIQWRFEHLNSPIAEINRKDRKISKHDGPDGRFRHRLQLDYWTGSLTIRNIRTEHSGDYEVDIISSNHTIHKLFNVTVSGEVKSVSVMKGESVTLLTGLTEIQRDDFITWMFGDIILAEIYKNQSSLAQLFYEYDGADERFRDGLVLNNQNGSLTITQCRTSNSGLYELKINRHAIYRRFTLTVSALSSGEKAEIVVGVLLVCAAVVAVVIYHRCKNSKLKHEEKSVMEGDPVTLKTDAELQRDDQILLIFGDENSHIAEIKREDIFVLDERFRDRLELDHQTGSLIITNTRTTDSGEYTLQISSGKNTFKRFHVSVFGE